MIDDKLEIVILQDNILSLQKQLYEAYKRIIELNEQINYLKVHHEIDM
jgi:predicted RNase H-like nuclease (RuvC/YqgF family)